MHIKRNLVLQQSVFGMFESVSRGGEGVVPSALNLHFPPNVILFFGALVMRTTSRLAGCAFFIIIM